VPFVTERYYRPEAAEGRRTDATCPPAPSVWLFDRDGVIVGARATRETGAISIELTFEIPEGKLVQLVEDAIAVEIDGRSSRAPLRGSTFVSWGKTREVAADESLEGASRHVFQSNYTPYYGVSNAVYAYRATVETGTPPELLDVRLPKFRVNGAPRSLPDVRFQWDSVFHWIYGLNC
jgi:hypothetical protein